MVYELLLAISFVLQKAIFSVGNSGLGEKGKGGEKRKII
jgi:hypothetical protein